MILYIYIYIYNDFIYIWIIIFPFHNPCKKVIWMVAPDLTLKCL